MSKLRDKVRALFADGAVLTKDELADKCGLLSRKAGNLLYQLKAAGEIKRKDGKYSLGSAKATTKAARKRRASPPPKRAKAQAAEKPYAALTADHRIILLGAAGGGVLLTVDESLEVANLVFAHFQAA